MTKRKVLAVVSACALLLTMFVSLIPVYAGKPDDTTGWTLGEGSTITGNPDEGWLFKQTAGRDAAHQNKYVTDIPLRDLQVQFIANYADNKLWTINLSDRDLNPLPGEEALGETGICLILEKAGDNSIHVQRWAQSTTGVYLYQLRHIPFDFGATHVLHFVEQDGKWYIAIDDVVLEEEVIRYDGNNDPYNAMETFVEGSQDVSSILTAMDGKQTVFESAADCNVTFPYINFADGTEIANWQYTSQVAVAGSEERGFTMVGKEGSDGYAVYEQPVSLLNNEFQVRLDFDSDWTYFGFDTVPEVTGENNKLNADIDMQFYIKDGRLDIGLYSGGQPVTDKLYSIENFDFDAVHVFGFVEDNEQYYLTVDGKRAPYNEILSNHVAEMKDAGVYWRLGAGNGTTVQYFTDIKVLSKIEGWTIGTDGAVSALPDGGWTLTQGAGRDAAHQNKYVTDIPLRDLQVQFIANYADNKLWTINLSDRDLNPLPGEEALGETGICLILEKAGDNSIHVQRWAQSTTGVYLYQLRHIPFDFGATHVLHFVEQDGKWYIAIDDVVLEEEVIRYDGNNDPYNAMETFVEGSQDVSSILTAMDGKTVIFESAADCVINFPYINFVDANDVKDPADDWILTGDVTVEGSAAEGYTLTGGAHMQAAYKTAVDPATKSVKMVFDPGANNWYGLNITDTPETGELLGASETQISLIFGRHTDTILRVSVWNDSTKAEEAVAYIDNYDFTAEHTFGFTKVGETWCLNVDGVAYVDTETTGAAEKIATFMNNMAGKDAYFCLQSWDSEMAISNIRLTDTAVNATVANGWKLTGGVTLGGNADEGYTLTGGPQNQTTYMSAIDLGTKSVSMVFDPGFTEDQESTQWHGLNFSDNQSLGNLFAPTATQLTLVLGRENETTLRVSVWNGSREEAITYVNDFDWTAAHTYGFTKIDDNWFLNIDGAVYTDASAEVTEKLTAFMDNMAGKNAYAGVQSWTSDMNVSGFRIVDTEYAGEEGDWRLSGEAKAEGDRENGYALSGKGYAAYKTPFDMADWSVKMQFVPTFDDSNPEQIVNGWQAIVFSDVCTVDTTVLPGVPTQGGEHNVLTFILGREANGTTMRLSLFMQVGENKAERAITYIDDFDWDAEHTFGFAKVGDNWYVVFDGKTYTSPSGDTEDRIITSAITDVLNAMNGKDAYIRVEASDALNMPKFNLVETGRNEQEEGEWELSTDMTAEETANGWTVSGIPGIAGWKEVFAVDQDVFRIQFKPEVGNWAYFSVGDTYSVSAEQFMGPDNDNNMICFILGREDENTLRLSMWNGTAESAMVYIHSFDFDKAHDFQFVQRRGNWYLSIDGRTILSPQDDGDDKIITNWITEAVNNLKGNEAYIRVSACAGVPITLTNIQMIGEGHDNSSGSQTGVVFPIAAVAALGVSFLAVLVLRKKKA